MGRDWMNKWEGEADERLEKSLKREIDECYDKIKNMKCSSNPMDYKELRRLLKIIADKYNTLKVQRFDYDEEDYNRVLEELYKILEEENRKDRDSESWEAYRKEEEEGEEEEER